MITLEESLPIKNDNYLLAEDVFYIQFNQIAFYIEDTDQENFYFNILKKLFPQIEIGKIFPLNGKDNVIKECKKNIGQKNKIFLVDKDFDDLLDKKIESENLFYLDKYSIENYLLEENSIIEYIISEKPKLKRDLIISTLEFVKILETITKTLRDIIHIFLLVQNKCPKLKNISLNYERFYDFNNGNFTLKENQLNIYIQSITDELNTIDKRLKFETQLKKIKKDFNFNTDELCLIHFPGKFLIRMLKQSIESKFGLNSRNIESFSYIIATNCSFNSLENLKNDITNYLN